MQIIAATALKYSRADKTAIDCIATFDDGSVLPFTVVEDDSTTYGQAVWMDMIAGQFGPIAPYNALSLTPMDEALVAVSAGVHITSASTPALNGAYAVDPAAQAQINAVVTYTLLNNVFPNNAATLAWPDMSFMMHSFPTVASFHAFASAAANFVTQAMIYGNSNGQQGSIPSNNITIL